MLDLGDGRDIDISTIGMCGLGYGDTDSGKTVSALTLPDPILFVNTEKKNPKTVHAQFSHNKRIAYRSPESFDDLMDHLDQWIFAKKEDMVNPRPDKPRFPFASIFLDGLTFTQSGFRHQLEDDRYGARALENEEKTDARGLTDRFRFEKPDWGSIGSMMSRMTGLLNTFSQLGIIVICTAIASHDSPKYAGGTKTAPSLVGMDYTRLLHGYFDLIGYIVRPFRIEIDPETKTKIIKKPVISFHSDDDSYMARSSSLELIRKGPAPLDWTKIISVLRAAYKAVEI